MLKITLSFDRPSDLYTVTNVLEDYMFSLKNFLASIDYGPETENNIKAELKHMNELIEQLKAQTENLMSQAVIQDAKALFDATLPEDRELIENWTSMALHYQNEPFVLDRLTDKNFINYMVENSCWPEACIDSNLALYIGQNFIERRPRK